MVLSCQVPPGVLEGTSYLWYQDGQPLPESNSATLRFAAITLSQAGAYHCRAQAPGSATMSLAAPVSLHVSCKLSSFCVSWGWGEGEGNKGTAGGWVEGALALGSASTREHLMRNQVSWPLPASCRCPSPGHAYHPDGHRPQATGPPPVPCEE